MTRSDSWEYQIKENWGYLDHHQGLGFHGHGLCSGHQANAKNGFAHLDGHLGHDLVRDSVLALCAFPHLEGLEVEPWFLYKAK